MSFEACVVGEEPPSPLRQFLNEFAKVAPRYKWNFLAGRIRCEGVKENGELSCCPVTFVAALRCPGARLTVNFAGAEAFRMGLSRHEVDVLLAAADGNVLQVGEWQAAAFTREVAGVRALLLDAVGLQEVVRP